MVVAQRCCGLFLWGGCGMDKFKRYILNLRTPDKFSKKAAGLYFVEISAEGKEQMFLV